MKKLSPYIPLFFGLAGIASAITGCATSNGTEHPQVCTVMTLSGGAQYWEGESNKVQTIRRGDQIPPGSTIQTANGPGNYVTLATGEHFLRSNRRPPTGSGDRVIIYDNSILKLSKTAIRTVGGIRIPDTRMLLLQGSILFDREIKSPAPTSKSEIARTEQEKPYFELRSSNIVVRGNCATLWFSASGTTGVLQGLVEVERVDQKVIKEISSSQKYDAVTGEISPVEDDVKRNMLLSLHPDFAPAPAFEVPRRPF